MKYNGNFWAFSYLSLCSIVLFVYVQTPLTSSNFPSVWAWSHPPMSIIFNSFRITIQDLTLDNFFLASSSLSGPCCHLPKYRSRNSISFSDSLPCPPLKYIFLFNHFIGYIMDLLCFTMKSYNLQDLMPYLTTTTPVSGIVSTAEKNLGKFRVFTSSFSHSPMPFLWRL